MQTADELELKLADAERRLDAVTAQVQRNDEKLRSSQQREIQHLNRFGLGPLDALVDAAGRIRELVASGDEQGFVELMQRGREYLALRS